MNFFKYFLLIFVTLFFVSCGQTSLYNFSEKNNTLSFGLNKDNYMKIKFTKPTYTDSFDSCAVLSYTISDKNAEYGKIFIENINLAHNCVWNGLATSFIESDFKDKLKLSSIEVVEELDIKNYNFKTYLINKKSYMSLIYIFSPLRDIIIIDYDGKLYDEVLRSFRSDYTNKYLSKKRYTSNYNESLVRNNMFNNYFSRQRESNRNN